MFGWTPTCFSPYLYRARNLVERFFNKIKQCRRVATRYDKLAANYLAFVQLCHRKSGLPDVRQPIVRNSGKPEFRCHPRL